MTNSSPSISKRRRIFFRLLIVVVFLGAVEGVLRLFGFQPGYLGAYPWEFLPMSPVDSLVVTPEYYVGEDRIYRANPEYVFEAYAQLNAEGFRSIPFDTHAVVGKRRVLWLGDSFCWGASAQPLTQSYVDLVAEETGWACFNTGIPGAGPPHYAQAAKTYIPTLRPQDVAVTFYMSNDILYDRRPVQPNQSPWHITNAGWIEGHIDGQYCPTAQEAYACYIRRFSLPDRESRWFNRVCSWTATGTRIWHLLALSGVVERYDATVKANIDQYEAKRSDTPVSVEYLREIRTLCETHDARFHLFVIQIHSHLEEEIDQTHPGLFGDLPWQQCHALERSDYYEWPNGHFNNEGHRKFADFIIERMK